MCMWFSMQGNNSLIKNESHKYTLVESYGGAILMMVEVNFFEASCRQTTLSSSLVHCHKNFQRRYLKNIYHAMVFPNFITNQSLFRQKYLWSLLISRKAKRWIWNRFYLPSAFQFVLDHIFKDAWVYGTCRL